jgi:uncharacterized membrane protein YfcA
MNGNDALLTILLALMALLYASVGHAGSSGYQAAMGIMGVSAAMMKPTALCLNLVVASIGTIQFARAGYINWRHWFWLVITSVPAAYLGGYFTLPAGWYHVLVALVLWAAAVRLWMKPTSQGTMNDGAVQGGSTPVKELSPLLAHAVGLCLGFLSGLTGTGGGIFLTPFLVLGGWATPRQAAGLSVAFILANSPAALIGWWGQQTKEIALPPLLPLWMVIVAGFGWLGAWFGSKYGSPLLLRRLLSLVLVIAGAKMVLAVLK